MTAKSIQPTRISAPAASRCSSISLYVQFTATLYSYFTSSHCCVYILSWSATIPLTIRILLDQYFYSVKQQQQFTLSNSLRSSASSYEKPISFSTHVSNSYMLGDLDLVSGSASWCPFLPTLAYYCSLQQWYPYYESLSPCQAVSNTMHLQAQRGGSTTLALLSFSNFVSLKLRVWSLRRTISNIEGARRLRSFAQPSDSVSSAIICRRVKGGFNMYEEMNSVFICHVITGSGPPHGNCGKYRLVAPMCLEF